LSELNRNAIAQQAMKARFVCTSDGVATRSTFRNADLQRRLIAAMRGLENARALHYT